MNTQGPWHAGTSKTKPKASPAIPPPHPSPLLKVGWTYDATQTFENVAECYCQKLSITQMYAETFFFQTKAELSVLATDR